MRFRQAQQSRRFVRQGRVACQRCGQRICQKILKDGGIEDVVAGSAEKLNDRSASPGFEPCCQRMRTLVTEHARGIVGVDTGGERQKPQRNQTTRDTQRCQRQECAVGRNGRRKRNGVDKRLGCGAVPAGSVVGKAWVLR